MESWGGPGLTELLGTTRTGLQKLPTGFMKGKWRTALKILLWLTEKMRRGCGMIVLVTTQVIVTLDMFARNQTEVSRVGREEIIDKISNNSSGASEPSSTVTSTAGSTLNPTDIINAANDAINKANEDYAKATEDINTANAAIIACDMIQSALSPSSAKVSGRIKIRASKSVGLVSGCSDFSTKYNSLLEGLDILTDDNIGLIKQLVTVLTAALPVPCTDTEKETLKTSTESKVSAAKAKAQDFKEEKEQKIEEFVQIVKESNQQIQEANNQLVAIGAQTIPVATVSFTIPTDPPTSQQQESSTGPQTSPEGSTGPQTSPESSTGPDAGTDHENSLFVS